MAVYTFDFVKYFIDKQCDTIFVLYWVVATQLGDRIVLRRSICYLSAIDQICYFCYQMFYSIMMYVTFCTGGMNMGFHSWQTNAFILLVSCVYFMHVF